MDMMFMGTMVQRKAIASGKPLILHAHAKGEPIVFKRSRTSSMQVAIKDLDGVTSEHATMVAAPAGTAPQGLADGIQEEEEAQTAEEEGEGEGEDTLRVSEIHAHSRRMHINIHCKYSKYLTILMYAQ